MPDHEKKRNINSFSSLRKAILINVKCRLHYLLLEATTRGTAGHQCQTESRLRIAGIRYLLFPSNHCIFLSSLPTSPCFPRASPFFSAHFQPPPYLVTDNHEPTWTRKGYKQQPSFYTSVSKNLHKNQRSSQ